MLRGRGLTLKYELIKRNADEATISKEIQKWEMAREERGKKKAANVAAKQAEAEAAQKAEEAAAAKAEADEAAAEESVEEPVESTES